MIASLTSTISSTFQPKPAQTLDPISTLCMLAARSCKVFNEHRPAVSDNWFYFEENGYFRSISKVSSNDLQILKKQTIPFFIKTWDTTNPELVEIVKLAIQGIEHLHLMYQKEADNSIDTCDKLKELLVSWLPPAKPEENKPNPIKAQNLALIEESFAFIQQARANKKAQAQEPAGITLLERVTLALQGVHIAPQHDMPVPIKNLSAQELLFKEKIDAIWTAVELKYALSLLQKKETDTLMISLGHKKTTYLQVLKSLEN